MKTSLLPAMRILTSSREDFASSGEALISSSEDFASSGEARTYFFQ
jgi:hypothetical protein